MANVTWYYCDIEGCTYKTKQKCSLKPHKAKVHNIDVTWYYCDIEGCTYKTKQKCHLKQHKAFIHNIDVTWYKCDVENCDYKAKQNTHLKQHKTAIHDIDVTWYKCDVENCDYKVKQKSSLKPHKANIHDIDVTWYYCDIEGCTLKTKKKSSLKPHKAFIHNIGVTWYYCDIEGCTYKAKQKSHLKTHKSDVHDIGVTWYYCDIEGCTLKTKQKSHLKEHKANIHDIGNKVCDICLSNVYSLTPYKDVNGTHNICRKCYRKNTGYTTRVEKQMVEYLKSIEEIKPYIVLEDRILRGNLCNTKRRPDLLLSSSEDFHIVVECDEKQHRGNSYSCETGRMNEIIDELNGRVIFIRWNPDSYKKKKNLIRNERLKLLKDLIIYICNKTDWQDDETIFCYYMFYSLDNEIISQTINNKIIFDKNDF